MLTNTAFVSSALTKEHDPLCFNLCPDVIWKCALPHDSIFTTLYIVPTIIKAEMDVYNHKQREQKLVYCSTSVLSHQQSYYSHHRSFY